MFERYATGQESDRSLADWLNAKGARTARDRQFGKATVREMLCNAAYAGYVSGLTTATARRQSSRPNPWRSSSSPGCTPSNPTPANPHLDRAQELLGDFARFWHTEHDPAERRKLLASIFDHAWQDAGRIVAVKPRPAFGAYFTAIDQARPKPSGTQPKAGDKSGSDGTRTRYLCRDRARQRLLMSPIILSLREKRHARPIQKVAE